MSEVSGFKPPWGTIQGTQPPFLICWLYNKTIDSRAKAVRLLVKGEGKSGAGRYLKKWW